MQNDRPTKPHLVSSAAPPHADEALDGRREHAHAYSKADGVVRWQAQVVPYADCVEVAGSHVELIFNRKSYRAIAVALAAAELPSG